VSSTADKLEQEIKSLADVDKLRLVDAILADLERPDPEIARIRAEEARERWEAYKAGRLRTVSYDEVMSNTEADENTIPRSGAKRSRRGRCVV
jgi:Putative addiction module component